MGIKSLKNLPNFFRMLFFESCIKNNLKCKAFGAFKNEFHSFKIKYAFSTTKKQLNISSDHDLDA